MTETKSTIVEINNVVQSFRTGFWLKRSVILKGVSLQIPRGKIFGLLGSNGAGKTTLINLITGVRRPTSGVITINGVAAQTPKARACMGYLPERPYFYDHLTGEAFLSFIGSLAGMGKKQIAERIPEVLATVGMSHAIHKELRRYSKGMLQRIGIAQALIHDPDLIILDEPMSGLDPIGRKEIRELILSLHQEGKTIFFSSHIVSDIEAICHEVAVIQDGKVLGSGPLSNFLSGKDTEVEIVFDGIHIKKAEVAAQGYRRIEEVPEGVRLTLPGVDLTNTNLRALIEAGARIHWVTPHQPSLESVFTKKEHEVSS